MHLKYEKKSLVHKRKGRGRRRNIEKLFLVYKEDKKEKEKGHLAIFFSMMV